MRVPRARIGIGSDVFSVIASALESNVCIVLFHTHTNLSFPKIPSMMDVHNDCLSVVFVSAATGGASGEFAARAPPPIPPDTPETTELLDDADDDDDAAEDDEAAGEEEAGGAGRAAPGWGNGDEMMTAGPVPTPTQLDFLFLQHLWDGTNQRLLKSKDLHGMRIFIPFPA